MADNCEDHYWSALGSPEHDCLCMADNSDDGIVVEGRQTAAEPVESLHAPATTVT